MSELVIINENRAIIKWVVASGCKRLRREACCAVSKAMRKERLKFGDKSRKNGPPIDRPNPGKG